MNRCRIPLDLYDIKPEGMTNYLRYNGWHFNRKMEEWATRQMRKNGEKIEHMDKENVEQMLQKHGVKLDYAIGYDHVYIANMIKSDFWKSSITEEAQMAKMIKDFIDDEDQKDGFIFNRFYADCCHNGKPIPWDDLL